MTRLYEIVIASHQIGRTLCERRESMTAREIAERANLPIGLVQKRLRERGWRTWQQLTQSPQAAKAAQVKASRRQLANARAERDEDRERAAAHQRTISRGHRVI